MKRCPFCAEEIQDAAIKCRFCNSMLTAPAASAAGPLGLVSPPSPANPQFSFSAASPPVAARTAVEQPRILFEGHPSWLASLAAFALCALILAAGIALTIILWAAYPRQVPALPALGAAISLGALGYGLYRYLELRSQHIRITAQSIDLETGLLGKRIDTLQLWRIRDINFEQSFAERLAGIARIHILSRDQEQPDLMLRGLPGSRQLFIDLRDAIAIARQARNVVGVVD